MKKRKKAPVLKLVPLPENPVSEITLKRLKCLEEEAERGSLIGIAGICLHTDNTVERFFSGSFDPYKALGAVQRLERDLLEYIAEGNY